MNKLKMNNSPHITSKKTTRSIMLDVIIALLPCVVCGTVFFGLYSFMLVCVCVLTCVLSEFIFCKIRKKPSSVGDLSSIITGLILGMNLPPNAPIYIPIIGGVFAIIAVKMIFGGLGKNFANPAATARVFLLLAYSSLMTKYIVPSSISKNYTGFGDLISGSTYLGSGLSATSVYDVFLGLKGLKALNLQLFLGLTGGCIGETSAIAIIAGAVYLTFRKVIDVRITLSYLLSAAFFALIFSGSINEVLPQLLSGGLMFASVFMATDYASSPKSIINRLIYGFGLGFMTMLVRFFGSYPEGASLAIVFMNLLVPMMDRYIVPVRFGEKRKDVLKTVITCVYSVMAAVIIVALPLTINRYSYAESDILNVSKSGANYIITVKGYADPLDKKETNIMNGSVTLQITFENGKITEIKETSRKGLTYNSENKVGFDFYLGDTEQSKDNTVSGATYSTEAVNNAVAGAVKWYREELSGGAK